MVTDNKTNVVFKYFWVNSFKWLNPADNERNGGHPKKGLYQGWLNTDTNTNRLYYKKGSALWLDKLICGDSDMLEYTSNIVEVNGNTILDLPLTEKDLDNLANWLETDNKNVKDVIFPESVPVPIAKLIADSIGKLNQENAALDDFQMDTDELFELDRPIFDQIHNLVRYSLDTIYQFQDGPLDADYLSLDKTRAGLGFNIGKAQEAIFRYVGTDRRTNEDPVDLLEAIYHLLIELKRRDHHNLNE